MLGGGRIGGGPERLTLWTEKEQVAALGRGGGGGRSAVEIGRG